MNLRNSESKELAMFLFILIVATVAFLFKLFGIIGLRFGLGFILVSLPFYIILRNFDLSEGERFVFSILLGITLFPSLVYLLGLVISFKLSIGIAFVIFLAVGFGIKKYIGSRNAHKLKSESS